MADDLRVYETRSVNCHDGGREPWECKIGCDTNCPQDPCKYEELECSAGCQSEQKILNGNLLDSESDFFLVPIHQVV